MFRTIFKSNKDMKKTKVFAHEGKIGIIPGDLNISMDMENDELISIENLEITKEAFDIITENISAEILVISGYFGFPGINSKILSKGKSISEYKRSELKEQIVEDIKFEEEEEDIYQEMVKEMTQD